MKGKKINILHINCNYTGTKLHQNMIDYLNEYTNNTVFCPVYFNSHQFLDTNKDIIVSKCFNHFDRFLFFHKQKKILKSILMNLDVSKYQCIHAYTLFTDGNCALEINKKYGIPYVVAVRATDFSFLKYRINLRKKAVEILKNASKVFFLSKKTCDIFINNNLFKDIKSELLCKIEIIPNGIDDFWLENCFIDKKIHNISKKINNKNLNLITVSQIIKRKNIPVVQQIVNKLNKQGWNIHYEVIGKDINRKLKQKICNNKYTHYYNHMSKEELLKHYRKADIFILPSKNETFGLVYAEAMTQGLAVLYSKNEGFDGQFCEGMVGYAIDPYNLNDIESKIELSIINYDKICHNSIQLCKNFKWRDIVEKYYKIYINLVGDQIEN